jgi:hypothetical protein
LWLAPYRGWCRLEIVSTGRAASPNDVLAPRKSDRVHVVKE